jgi:glutathionylspermidine synthase
MYKEQRAAIEKLLFENCLESSYVENEIFSPFAFYLDSKIHSKMKESSIFLSKIIIKISENIDLFRLFVKNRSYCFDFSRFNYPTKNVILSKCCLYQKEDGSVLVNDVNFDYPFDIKDIFLSLYGLPAYNPGKNFSKLFGECLHNMATNYFGIKRKFTTAIIVDNNKLIDVHTALLMTEALKPFEVETIVIGIDDLYVKENIVYAFDNIIDILIRYCNLSMFLSSKYIQKIIELSGNGKVLLTNNIEYYSKESVLLFSFLWSLLEENNSFLTNEERRFINRSIPYTKILESNISDSIINNKNKYLLKPAFSNIDYKPLYGKDYTTNEWCSIIKDAQKNLNTYVIQEYYKLKKERILKFNGFSYKEENAIGNFGLYMISGNVSATAVKWTYNQDKWYTPLGLCNNKLSSVKSDISPDTRKELWTKISNTAAFEYGYTSSYTGMYESFTIDSLVISKDKYNELINATNAICALFNKITKLVQENYQALLPILGIQEELYSYVNTNFTDQLAFLGKLDWVIDQKGNFKLLEFNSETPTGIAESLVINELIYNEFGSNYINPNVNLKSSINTAFNKIISDIEYKTGRKVTNIGFLSSTYPDDWSNTDSLLKCLNNLGDIDISLYDLTNINIENNTLGTYDKTFDAVFRYYPLDWFPSNKYLYKMLKTFNGNSPSINPPSSLISQSKAFMALIWELFDQNYFEPADASLIKKYIPRSALSPKKLKTNDFCAKPYHSREGDGIIFSYGSPGIKFMENEYVFQERIDIKTFDINVHTTLDSKNSILYPIIGTYVAGNSYAGVNTQLGGRVTDRWSIFAPLYVD